VLTYQLQTVCDERLNALSLLSLPGAKDSPQDWKYTHVHVQ